MKNLSNNKEILTLSNNIEEEITSNDVELTVRNENENDNEIVNEEDNISPTSHLTRLSSDGESIESHESRESEFCIDPVYEETSKLVSESFLIQQENTVVVETPIEEINNKIKPEIIEGNIINDNISNNNIESLNTPLKERGASPFSPISQTQPSNARELVIKNLDTGEEFIIGENDPDFEFDTFELCADEVGDPESEAELELQKNTLLNATNNIPIKIIGKRPPWWTRLYVYLKGGNIKKANDDLKSSKPKTPFTKLSSFKFRRELGRGAFGRVLLAEAKVDGKLYALKIISKKNMRSSDKKQAKAERDILHAMGHLSPHPFTSSLKFAFQSENNLYLGLDFLPGGNLRELIRKHEQLPEAWVQFYSAEMILAISHLHSINVLYRDIKPHNVMLDGQGHIILIDFGLSKQQSDRAMSLVGTPDYSAPEVLKTGVYQIEKYNKQKLDQANGKKVKKSDPNDDNNPNIGYGKAADWWSVGVMIYEMLGGLPAFRGVDLRQTYQKVLFAELIYKPSEKFSTHARGLIGGLLKRDPLERLGTSSVEDIKSQDFFQGINWDDIYNRKTCGPWVPDPVFFSSSKRTQSVHHESKNKNINDDHVNENEDKNKIDEFDNFNRKSSNDNCDLNGELDNRKPTLVSIDKNDIKKRTVSSSDKKKNQSQSDILEMRESIFIGAEKSKIQDWSFVDESVLVTAHKESTPFKDSRSNSITSSSDINTLATSVKGKDKSESLLIDM